MDDREGDPVASPEASRVAQVLRYVSGDPAQITVDRRVYRMICASSVIICLVLVAPINAVVGVADPANIPTTLLAAASAVFYWRARGDHYYRSWVMASVLLTLDASWFVSDGSKGSTPAFLPGICMFLSIYPQRRSRVLGAGAIVLNCGALFLADYFFPSLRMPYPTEAYRFFDVAAGTVISGIASGIILSVILDSHRWEKHRLETTNTRLANSVAEIRTLRGLLPVCSWCRKVRDDQGLWTQVEQYLTEHTDAQFTHGICPECEKRFFAEEQPAAREGEGTAARGGHGANGR